MTLIEIMIVIAIISLVLGGIGLVAFRQYTRAQLTTAHTRAVQLVQAVDMYRAEKRGRCPPTIEVLEQRGMLTRAPVDPWGSRYDVKCEEGSEPVVTSPGPDKELGTDDDISSDEEDPGEGENEEPA